MSWQLKQIKQVVRSSLAAETLAMIDGVETALYVNLLLKEFWSAEHVIPIHCITNNKLLYDQLKLSKYVSDKRLKIDISTLKELIQSNIIHMFK